LDEDGAIHDDLVAGVQTFGNVVSIAGAIPQRNVLPGEAAIGLDEVHEGEVFIVAQNGGDGDEEAGAFLMGLNFLSQNRGGPA